jgi:cell division septal protein FtsQ
MGFIRHRVRVRKAHVRYRFVRTAAATGRWTARAALVALGFWAADGGHRLWRQSPQLKVRAVRVADGVPAALGESLGVKPGDHLFAFSTARLERRLERTFPELTDVSVRRDLRRGLSVSAAWRTPRARLPHGEGWLGIDAGGAAFPLGPNVAKPEDLPVLAGVPAGKGALPALRFLESLRAADAPWTGSLEKLQASGGEAVLHLAGGPPVHWGPMEPAAAAGKAARLERVLRDELLKDGAAYVRFVTDDRVAVKILQPAQAGKKADEKKRGTKKDG